jgi:hypothetical protein
VVVPSAVKVRVVGRISVLQSPSMAVAGTRRPWNSFADELRVCIFISVE